MVKLSALPQQNCLKQSSPVKRLDLKVGYFCSNDCLFCVVAAKRPFGDKTTKQIKDELKGSYVQGIREVVFTGGEVTVRNDIFEIVSFARELGYGNIQIQTNGRRFSSLDFTKKMILSGMTEFAPAVHGHTAELHDFLTQRPGSWRQTILGIHNVRKVGIRILTNTVITTQNYRYLPEIASLLTKLKVAQFQFAFVHIMGNALKNHQNIVPRVSRVASYLRKGLNIGIKSGIRVMAEAIPLCLMKGYEKYASEFYIPNTQIKEVGWQVDNFEEVRKESGKKKFLSCLKCKWYSNCEGPWKEYPQLFNEREFKPILN